MKMYHFLPSLLSSCTILICSVSSKTTVLHISYFPLFIFTLLYHVTDRTVSIFSLSHSLSESRTRSSHQDLTVDDVFKANTHWHTHNT